MSNANYKQFASDNKHGRKTYSIDSVQAEHMAIEIVAKYSIDWYCYYYNYCKFRLLLLFQCTMYAYCVVVDIFWFLLCLLMHMCRFIQWHSQQRAQTKNRRRIKSNTKCVKNKDFHM